LTVENITLNAADATIQVRLIVDTDTAWFTMPMFAVGPVAQPWTPRGFRHVPVLRVDQVNLAGTGDVAWSDTDCTANTDPLAIGIDVQSVAIEPNGLAGSTVDVGHDSALLGADSAFLSAKVYVVNISGTLDSNMVRCDDGQIIRYKVNEVDADNDVTAIIRIYGYWMWE
jgi:hypothetical protein